MAPVTHKFIVLGKFNASIYGILGKHERENLN